jgi:hypothetical protein
VVARAVGRQLASRLLWGHVAKACRLRLGSPRRCQAFVPGAVVRETLFAMAAAGKMACSF